MELGVVTVMHGRHGLTELWAKYTTGLELPVFACITEGDSVLAGICDRYGIVYTERPNNALGAKHNAALGLCNADRVMLLPSDDFVAPGWVDKVRATDVPYLYPDSCGMYDVATGRACVLRHEGHGVRKFGAARVLRRDVVEAVGVLWTPEAMRGLDSDSHARVMGAGFEVSHAGIGAVPVVDIKAGENLWTYDRWARGRAEKVDAGVVLHMLPEDVRGALSM